MDERRACPRREVAAPIAVEAADGRVAGTVRDLCRDAVLFAAAQGWSVGTEVRLEITLPSLAPVRAGGRVVRVSQEDGETLVAVLFTDVSPEAASRIGAFVALEAGD